MRDVAEVTRGTVVAVYAATVVMLLIIGALSDGPLLTDTAMVSLPIAALLVFGFFGLIKRRYRA